MGDLTTLQDAIERAKRLVPEPEEHREREESDRRKVRADMLDHSGCRVPDEMRATIIAGTIEHRRPTQLLFAWLSNPHRTAALVLCSTAGAGKTVALATLAASTSVIYQRADDLCRTFSANFGEQLAKQERIKDARCVLTLDDIGTETDDVRMLPTLLEILDARASARHTPTVITTNLTKKDFADRYKNERLMSRMARVQWDTVQGEDLRRQK